MTLLSELLRSATSSWRLSAVKALICLTPILIVVGVVSALLPQAPGGTDHVRRATEQAPSLEPKPTIIPRSEKERFENTTQPPIAPTDATAIRGVVGDWWADAIVGQPDFAQITPNEVVGNKLFNPGGVYVDRSTDPNRVYIYDAGNNRVLGFSSVGMCLQGANQDRPCTSQSDCPGSICQIQTVKPADLIIGQPSDQQSTCNGDSALQHYPAEPLPTARTLCGTRPSSISILESGSMVTMAADSQSNFYVPDFFNNRILRYDNPFATDTVADHVWGQQGFTGSLCNDDNMSEPGRSSLCLAPLPGFGNTKTGVGVDAADNLWVADTQNNRVLRFPRSLNAAAPSQAADLVLGQPDFTSSSPGTHADEMHNPASVRIAGNGTVYVADSVNADDQGGRILIFTPPLTSGMEADHIINVGKEPTGLELDPGGGLWVNTSDNDSVLFFSQNELRRTVAIPRRVWGGIGVDHDGNLLVTGWDSQQVEVYSPPEYLLKSTLLTADEYGSFNSLGSRGFTDPGGLEVATGQLIVADGPRLLFWNIPWTLANDYRPADGVVGQPDFQTRPRWAPSYGRMRADAHDRLWVVKGQTWETTAILSYQLPLRSHAEPILQIESPVALLGGGEFSWTGELRLAGIDIQPSCDCLWLSDSGNNRVFRIRNASSTGRFVDIVLGQRDVNGTHCNQGRDSDDGYTHPSSPSRDSLCHPGALTFDRRGNLYIADHNLEVAGNWRLLEFNAATLPSTPTAAVFGLNADRVFGRNSSFTAPECIWDNPMCGPWEPAFSSKNEMIIGFNGYLGPRFAQVYENLLVDPLPSDALGDFSSHPYSIRFDNFDNLYVLDLTRNRVLMYWAREMPIFSVSGNVQTAMGHPISGVQIDMVGYPVASRSDSAGSFRLTGLVAGSYRVIPERWGCHFTPPELSVVVSSQTGPLNFVAECGGRNAIVALPLTLSP